MSTPVLLCTALHGTPVRHRGVGSPLVTEKKNGREFTTEDETVSRRSSIIEEWGRGTLKMAELATSAGLPRPEIEYRGDCVTVCFRHGRVVPSRRTGNDLIERQEAILALLDRADDGLALRKIRAHLALHASERQMKRALAALRNRGLAASTDRGPAARWRRVSGSVEDE